MMEVVGKVWGHELILVNEPEYCMKLLTYNSGFQGSLHYHRIKKETFVVEMGECDVELKKKNGEVRKVKLCEGDTLTINPGHLHRVSVPLNYSNLCEILEVSTHHDDADVYREEDSREI